MHYRCATTEGEHCTLRVTDYSRIGSACRRQARQSRPYQSLRSRRKHICFLPFVARLAAPEISNAFPHSSPSPRGTFPRRCCRGEEQEEDWVGRSDPRTFFYFVFFKQQ